MITAYQQIRETRRRHGDKPDLRTAAFIMRDRQDRQTYGEMGIFP